VALRRLGATIAKRDQQLVQIGPSQLLHGEIAVPFDKRSHGVAVGVDRRRAGVVQ
jgi:hypothetical protein